MYILLSSEAILYFEMSSLCLSSKFRGKYDFLRCHINWMSDFLVQIPLVMRIYSIQLLSVSLSVMQNKVHDILGET